jgi:tartrate-resistant acid phosphatase type 5
LINNGTQDLIHVLMLDTVLLCGNTASDFGLFGSQYETQYSDTTTNNYFENIEKKLEQISNTPVPYIIVAGHYPVWSIGIHGPSECLVQKLRPLLHKYRVSAYFSGHDHDLQHIQDTYLNTTVDYFVSGAANYNTDSRAHENSIPKDSLKYFNGLSAANIFVGSFSFVKASLKNMNVMFYNTLGEILYQKVILPRILKN